MLRSTQLVPNTAALELVGSGEAVRFVLRQRHDQKGFGAVMGVLSDLIQTDTAHAAAVEAALGPALQALVVPSLASLPGEEELSKLPGRVMLLPATPVRIGV